MLASTETMDLLNISKMEETQYREKNKKINMY